MENLIILINILTKASDYWIISNLGTSQPDLLTFLVLVACVCMLHLMFFNIFNILEFGSMLNARV
jgi:hypothetical protein